MTGINEELIKEEFSLLNSYYFNAAYFGPSPLRCKKSVEDTLLKELNPSFVPYEDWYYKPETSRRLFGKFLGVNSDNIFHACSVSDVNNIIAQGFPFEDGDVVTIIDKEYPSNVLPYMLKEQRESKISVQKLKLSESELPTRKWLENEISPKTKIFCVSWVTFDTGKKLNVLEVGKFLKERDILFVLDVTQGLGGLTLSEEEIALCDVICCASYKWLLGPYGHAFGYFSDKAINLLDHNNANWLTSINSKNVQSLVEYTTETLPGARKFDRGQTANLLTLSCVERSLEFLLELGAKEIETKNRGLVNYFIKNFSNPKFTLKSPSHESNILCFSCKDIDTNALQTKLMVEGIDVSIREGSLRLSFHLYNSIEQVDKLIEVLNS